MWYCGRGGISELQSLAKWSFFLHILHASFFAGQMFRCPGRNLMPHLRQPCIGPERGIGRMSTLFCLFMYCFFSNQGFDMFGLVLELIIFCCFSSPLSSANAYCSVSDGVLSSESRSIWIRWLFIPCMKVLLTRLSSKWSQLQTEASFLMREWNTSNDSPSLCLHLKNWKRSIVSFLVCINDSFSCSTSASVVHF